MHSHHEATMLYSRLPDCGPAGYWALCRRFGDIERAISADLGELDGLLSKAAITALGDFRRQPRRSPLTEQLARDRGWLQEQSQVALLHHTDPGYPTLLTEIPKPPPLLYVWGDPAVLGSRQLALVGSRNASRGGRGLAQDFAGALASAGFTITSGLAIGIDGAAHQGALDAGGQTIAVLGTGIDQVYPRRHKKLATAIIAQGGALISEFPLGVEPQPAHFPQRNRIISGLSLGTLVIEAASASGSLITARHALEQDREVFAIPGDIRNPLSRGCHALLREGATLVETVDDIVQQLDGLLAWSRSPEARPRIDVSEPEALLVESLGYTPASVDELVLATGLSAGEVASLLLQLELKGVVEQNGGGYQRTSAQVARVEELG